MNAPPAPPERLDRADEEALELMMRLAGRVMVARSLARIARGLVQESASRATEALRVYADVAISEVAPVARAAVEAAVHVATSRIPHVTPPEKKKKEDVELEEDEDEAPSSLDHEALHDDAC